MTQQEFVTKYLPFAKETFKKTGILPECILAQAALESGWGEHSPGYMFFGIKDFDGINGNEQLLTTFEYSSRSGLSPKQIGLETIEIEVPVTINNKKFFKYIGKAYFKKYKTPEESFTAHANTLLNTRIGKNGPLRYAKALAVKDDFEAFFKEIQAAGYAQSPTYAVTLISICKSIKKFM